MTIKATIIPSRILAAAMLIGSFACSPHPPALQQKAAERSVNAWLTANSAPFYKALGQAPPVFTHVLEVRSAPPPSEQIKPAEPANPNESIFYFEQHGRALIMVRSTQSDQFIGVTGGGEAQFVWEQNAWYLVTVNFRSGFVSEGIHWKVEDY